jgi:hypothetical protein
MSVAAGLAVMQTMFEAEIAAACDFNVDFCVALTLAPTGSAVRACRRVATPANIRPITTCVSMPSAAKCA